MRIDLEKVPPEGLKIKSREPVEILTVPSSTNRTKGDWAARSPQKQDVKFAEPVDVTLSVNLMSGTLLVKGRVGTKAGFACSRCLKEYEGEIENKNFNFTMYVAGLTNVDITDNLREGIMLLLPIKPLCKSDCRGLCVKCGQNLNDKNCGCTKKSDDTRWYGLDKLKL